MNTEVITMLIQEVGVWGAFTIAMYLIGEKRSNKREEKLMEVQNNREKMLMEMSEKREETLISMHVAREMVLSDVVEKNQSVIINLSSALEDVKEVKLDLREVKDMINNLDK